MSRVILFQEIRESHLWYFWRSTKYYPIENDLFSNRSIWLIDGTLTGTTTRGQSGPESDNNEEVTRILELMPHHQIQFCAIFTASFFGGGVLPSCRGYSQCILNFADSALLSLEACSYLTGLFFQIHTSLF